MKKLALLFVALMASSIVVTAAPLQTKTPQTTKEVASVKPTKHKANTKTHKEVKKTETAKPVAKK